MTTETKVLPLASLAYIPYIDTNGQLPEQFQGKIGVYAIFNCEKMLQFVGYSRDVDLSLKQHLVRQPQNCHWLKVQTIDHPSRSILENIREAWIAENGSVPNGNSAEEVWTQPINAKVAMSPEEQKSYAASDELTQSKLLKNIARKVEEQILAQLASRGVKMQIRFNPKLKEKGLLDLK